MQESVFCGYIKMAISIDSFTNANQKLTSLSEITDSKHKTLPSVSQPPWEMVFNLSCVPKYHLPGGALQKSSYCP